jgi:hypothetical protein
MSEYMTYTKIKQFNWMLEKMWDDGFCIPDTIIRHILDKLDWVTNERNIEMIETWDIFHDLPNTDEEDIYPYYDYSHTFIPLIFKLYGFWKMYIDEYGMEFCNKTWNKQSGFLLAEIIWLIIVGDFQKKNFQEGTIQLYHKKEKGKKPTRFHETLSSLKYSGKKNSWVKRLQNKYGDIIKEKQNGNIHLSENWEKKIESYLIMGG